jgi:hypothetical protein
MDDGGCGATSYMPVLDPFCNEAGSFARFKAVILDYNGTITVDTFATWKSTLLAAEATVTHYRERICEIYSIKRKWLKETAALETSCTDNGSGGVAASNGEIFGLSLAAIKDAARSSMSDITALRDRVMVYENPFVSFTCWRSCNPGSLEEYAEKAGLVDLLGYEEWNGAARRIMSVNVKMYRDFWVPRTSIPAPGLVSFVRHLEDIRMPWFIVSLHPVDRIKKEFGLLLQRAGAADMLKTFVDHVTPLQMVSPVRSRYECEINNHTTKETHEHVYCRQDKIATIEKILDDLLAAKNISESDVLNIGDSVLDLQVSLSLGMRFCGVHWGYCLRSTFKMNNAYVLPEYRDMSFLNAYADDPAAVISTALQPPAPPTPPPPPPPLPPPLSALHSSTPDH